jgi:hypothetical protein
MTTCARCSRPVNPKTAEVCFWCSRSALCGACWDAYGHCGHVEADLIELRGRLDRCRDLMRSANAPVGVRFVGDCMILQRQREGDCRSGRGGETV